MAIVEGTPTDRSGGAFYGPIRILDPSDGSDTTPTSADQVLCRGANAVYVVARTAEAGAQTFDAGAVGQIYQNAGATLNEVVAESGLDLTYTPGADVNEGTVYTFTPVGGGRISAYALGLKAVTSAEATGVAMDAYVSWE